VCLNALYDKGRESFLKGEFALASDNIKAVLVATTYAVNLATHQFLSDISSGDRIATSGNLANKTTAAGVFDADDVTYTAVSGAQISFIVLYKDTGVPSTSRLIAYIDTVTGFPFTPSGSDVAIIWANTSSKIFKL